MWSPAFDQRAVSVQWTGKLLIFYCSVEQAIYDRSPGENTSGEAWATVEFNDFKTQDIIDDPVDGDELWYFIDLTSFRPDTWQPSNKEATFNGDVTSKMLKDVNAWEYANPRGDQVDDNGNPYYSYDPTTPIEDWFVGGTPDGTYIETRGSFGVLVFNVSKYLAEAKKKTPNATTSSITGKVYLRTMDFGRIRLYVKPIVGVKFIDVGRITDTGEPTFNNKPPVNGEPKAKQPKPWADVYDSGFLPNSLNDQLRERKYELTVTISFKSKKPKAMYDLVETSGIGP